ncbi:MULTISPECIES: hypothetical protein [Kitasatospora]|uniref:Peptidase S8/S53 domain-containing protein n=1 Tax=Kitasatospora cystarginea TaxID=58350 RepID=A0ABN3F274_9ACTN
MASPHVAGVAALHKAVRPFANTEEVRRWIGARATKDVLSAAETSPNRLLFTGGL